MKKLSISVLVVAVAATAAFAQKPKATPAPTKAAKSIIFAVQGDGSSLEPIGYIVKGKLENTVDGAGEPALLTAFAKTYFKTGTAYKLIFGGADAGVVKVKSSNTTGDLNKNIADVTTTSTKVTLKGNRMALATNAVGNAKASGLRRSPTAAERTEAEALVKAEYVKNRLSPKELKSQNLVAIDVDGDGKVELVGSYWVDVDSKTRALFFFIADKRANGKYVIDHSEYQKVDQDAVMSKDIKDVDNGVYHELFLDYFDVDGDGVGEIFTTVGAFEGAEFHTYKRTGNKWARNYTFSNYHGAY